MIPDVPMSREELKSLVVAGKRRGLSNRSSTLGFYSSSPTICVDRWPAGRDGRRPKGRWRDLFSM